MELRCATFTSAMGLVATGHNGDSSFSRRLEHGIEDTRALYDFSGRRSLEGLDNV